MRKSRIKLLAICLGCFVCISTCTEDGGGMNAGPGDDGSDGNENRDKDEDQDAGTDTDIDTDTDSDSDSDSDSDGDGPIDDHSVCEGNAGKTVCSSNSMGLVDCDDNEEETNPRSCPEGEHCEDGKCVEGECVPYAIECTDTRTYRECASDGSEWSEDIECPHSYICDEDEGGCLKFCQNRVLIILDRSGSMQGTKWTQAGEAIDFLVTTYTDFEFGLSVFPTDNDCAVGSPVVAVPDNSAAEINGWMASNSPNGMTPMLEAMQQVHNSMPDGLDAEEYQRSVIIIADGSPNCDAPAFPRNALVAATNDLVSDGLKVYVIGFGTGVNANLLNAIAAAGGTSFPTYFQANNQTSLKDAFDQIALDLHSC